VVTEGYKIPFLSRPPVAAPRSFSPRVAKDEALAIEKEVMALLHKKAIEEASSPGFTSRLFTIPKSTGDLRPVLNLRPLNRYVPARSFKMETIKSVCNMLQKNDYLTSIDLADAFLHILIHPSHRKYLQFQWNGKQYQFRVLPFGLSLSPLVFTKVLKPVLRWARRLGIRISAYIDDLIIAAKTKELSKEHTRLVYAKLVELGYKVKETKSHLEPTQELDHLGFHLNTRDMTLAVPKTKLRNIRREAMKLRAAGTTTVRALSSFIGKAMATTAAVFPARLMTQHLTAVKNAALKTGALLSDTITLSPKAKDNLDWWITQFSSWNGLSWIQTPTQLDVYTDASTSGWGIVINDEWWSGQWSEADKDQHINWLELQTIFKAVKLPQVQGKMINLMVDNTTTIAYVNRFGGTRSPALMELAERIWQHCLQTGTRLRTTYVPSPFNPADAPSRQMVQQLEWSIDHSFFQQLDQTWGPHHVDVFATAQNSKTQQFFSWMPDARAIATDALRHSWSNLGNLYICPPWNLIPQVLSRLQQEGLSATIITPHWPTAIWFPTVSQMSIVEPIPVPRPSVRPAPGSASDILSKNPHWTMTAWRISGSGQW